MDESSYYILRARILTHILPDYMLLLRSWHNAIAALIGLPYPPSPEIAELVRAPTESIHRAAAGSDNWPLT
ncbi:MAG TPA: hypothetical protein VGA03_00720 [Anaerolineales bacterium]